MRASEELLATLHGITAHKIRALLESDDERSVVAGLNLALKFLKDNAISATIDASPDLALIKEALPDAAELERLMTLTPD